MGLEVAYYSPFLFGKGTALNLSDQIAIACITTDFLLNKRNTNEL